MTTHLESLTHSATPSIGLDPRTVRRAAGVGLVAAGTLCIAGGALHPVVDGAGHSVAALTSPAAPVSGALLATGTALLVLSLPTLHGWLAGRIGRLGSIGLFAYLVGNLVSASTHLAVELLVARPLAADPTTAGLIATDDSMLGTTAFTVVNTAGGIVMLGGMAAFGVDLLRTGAAPRWIGALTTAGMVGFFLPVPMTPVLSGLLYEAPRGVAVAALGALMIRSARRTHRS